MSSVENLKEQVVCVDGSCLSQHNKETRRAGYSAYFGPDDPRNVSEPIVGDKHTNNVGEIMGVIAALELSDPGRPLLIVSDSEYVIKGLVGEVGRKPWHINWQKNGWRTAARKPVANRDLWERMISISKKRKFRMVHQKAHSGHVGNEVADTLAKGGARRAERK
jgi:ribonuclease HI